MKYDYRYPLQLKLNLALSLLLILPILTLGGDYTPPSLATTLLGTVSTVLVFYGLFWLTLFPVRFAGRAVLWFGAIVFSLFDLFLLADFFIFRLYHTHINAMVLNIVFSPAAFRNMEFGIYPYVVFGILAVLLAGFQNMLLRRLPGAARAATINRRLNYVVVPAALLVVLLDKAIFGWANLYSRIEITEKMRVIPYYLPITYNRLASKYLGIEPAPKPLEMRTGGAKRLNYPKGPLVYADKFQNDNILVIMMDAVRWDMIERDTAPNLWTLKNESVVFDNHFSGGNATRFGVFSFFYGLNAPYWFGILDHQKPALLFDALRARDYNIRIISSSDLNWPEFRRTIFVGANDHIVDNLRGEVWEKDQLLTDHALQWLETDFSQPFFGFLFYDAPHQYSYPATHAKFTPDAAGDKNYLTLSVSKRDVLFNQYKNSIHYNDMLIGKIIAKLKARGLYDKTRVIITADHGEEFYESGGFGHNNAFSLQQIKPVLFMRIPGMAPKIVTQMTSHMDVAPTIMSWLGVSNPATDYSVGQNLFDSTYNRDYVMVGNWNYNAIVENGHTLVFSAHPNPMGGTRVFDTQTYQALAPEHSAQYTGTILKIMDENRRFYR